MGADETGALAEGAAKMKVIIVSGVAGGAPRRLDEKAEIRL